MTVGPRHLWQLILRDHFHLALLNRVSFSLIVSSINNVAQTHRASSVCSLSPIFDTHVHFRIFESFPRHCSATCPGNTRSNHFFLHLFSFYSSNLPSFILPAKQHNLINYSPYVHAIDTNKFSLTIRYDTIFANFLVSLDGINFSSKYFNERPFNEFNYYTISRILLRILSSIINLL